VVSRSVRRGVIALVVVAVMVGVVVVGVRALYGKVKTTLTVDQCTVGAFSLSTDQAAVASRMAGVVTRRHLPERAAVLVLAAGLQESKLRNIPAGQGDRDSVGVLQQRPSQGWGSAEQLSDVRYATAAFLDALVKVPNWQTDSLAAAIQAVQISADGNAYATHEAEAQALADALTGAAPAALSCTFKPPTAVATPATVAAELQADLPVNPPATGPTMLSVAGAGWPTAEWLVANADRLGIEQVGYAGKSWTRTDGWQNSNAPQSAVTAQMHG
jgi:hypothetical protein